MRIALAALLLLAAPAAAAPRTAPAADGALDAGWWVVVGSGPEPGSDRPSAGPAVAAAGKRCGFTPFGDFSAKFSGFAPGVEVYVLGAYRTEAAAARRLAAVRRCVPDAYLKAGSYAGE